MFVFRSLVTGFVGACFVLLAMYEPPPRIEPARLASCASLAEVQTYTRNEHPATIVDVAASVPASQIASFVHLESGEHVATVDDAPVANDLAAGVAVAAHARSFVDLGIEGPTGVRRVLLLIH